MKSCDSAPVICFYALLVRYGSTTLQNAVGVVRPLRRGLVLGAVGPEIGPRERQV
jgi:hypothetical protein